MDVAVEVFVANEQADEPVDIEGLGHLAEAALRAEGVVGPAECSLLFVDVEAIAALNERFLGRSGPTDVLSFPIEDDLGAGRSDALGEDGAPPTLVGDVVICPAVAKANAPGHAGSYEDELALLVVHGVLHLLGMDHEDPAEAEVMEARERLLLAAHHHRDEAER